MRYHHLSAVTHLLLVVLVVKVVLVVMWLVVPKGMHHAFIQHLLPAMKTSALISQLSPVILPDEYIEIFFLKSSYMYI